MKIFLTGATGFLGSHFLNEIFSQQLPIQVVAHKRSINSIPRVELSLEPEWLIKPLDAVSVHDLKGVDTIVHFAAHSMYPPYDDLSSCLLWNVQVPMQLFENAIKAGVKRIIISGSCFEYGDSGMEYDFIPVNATLKPTNTYAVSKATLSMAVYQFAKENNIELVYARVFHIYGEGEAENRLWPQLRKASLLGNDLNLTQGEQIRDFTPVNFVANRFIEFCLFPTINSPLYLNIGTGLPMSIRDFAIKYWVKWKSKGKLNFGRIPYRNGEVMRYVPKIND